MRILIIGNSDRRFGTITLTDADATDTSGTYDNIKVYEDGELIYGLTCEYTQLLPDFVINYKHIFRFDDFCVCKTDQKSLKMKNKYKNNIYAKSKINNKKYIKDRC